MYMRTGIDVLPKYLISRLNRSDRVQELGANRQEEYEWLFNIALTPQQLR